MAEEDKHENKKNDEDIKSTNDDKSSSDSKSLSTSTRKSYKYTDPPIIYTDVDGVSAIKKITELVKDKINDEEKQYLKEWSGYLNGDNDAWIIGNEHIDLITRFINGQNDEFPPNVPLLTLELLQAAALKDDFVLVLHQDRKDHRLMSYIFKIENLTLAEQENIAKLLCNFCSQPCSFDWLMYISEWVEADGQISSNSRVTTRVAVHTLLNDKLTTLQRTGVNLIFNLALKELFEDVATELATAVLQFLHGQLEEEQVYLCLVSLYRFMCISVNDVAALTQMLGPHIKKFRGISSRIDQIVDDILPKIAAVTNRYKQSSEDD